MPSTRQRGESPPTGSDGAVEAPGAGPLGRFDATAIRRPHQNLLAYYLLSSLRWGPLYPIGLLRNWFRYRTLEYQFDDEGVHMSWGVIFHHAISLNYARLQDIHLESHAVERWLGLARVQLQTAAGSAKAEMTIEGVQQFEELRDFLYSRMRGHRNRPGTAPGDQDEPSDLGAAVRSLQAACNELRAIRELVEGSAGAGAAPVQETEP
jgi:putative membrane protein